jgi:enoyl-CoA hydratase/carnithine racemase
MSDAIELVRWRVDEGAGVGVMTLARSEKKNALTGAMLARMKLLFEEGGRSAARGQLGAIVLEGEGAALCSGFDLTLCRDRPEVLGELLSGLGAVIRAMRMCEVPVVVAAHGAALAGGCALVCAGDVVITHRDAKLGYPVVRLGISPAVTGPVLIQAIGAGRTRERLLSSETISGREGQRLGLAHECAQDASTVRERAIVVASELAAKPRGAMRMTKRWLNEIDGSTSTERFDTALATSLSLVGSAEERERLAAIWVRP